MHPTANLSTVNVLADVGVERERQERLGRQHRAQGQHDWKTCADKTLSADTKLAVLVEEVGEVAHAMNEARVGNTENLREELIHVAAVAVAWAESVTELEPAPPEPINKQQIAAFHAMTSALDDHHGLPRGTWKARIKEREGKASTKDFTKAEAHDVLDLIAIDLDAFTPA